MLHYGFTMGCKLAYVPHEGVPISSFLDPRLPGWTMGTHPVMPDTKKMPGLSQTLPRLSQPVQAIIQDSSL